jgi:hypothetical protein
LEKSVPPPERRYKPTNYNMPGIFLYRPYQQRSRMEAADVPAAAKFGGERR